MIESWLLHPQACMKVEMSCIVGYRAHREVLLSLLNLSFSGDAVHCHCGGLATTQSQVPRFFCGSFCIRHGKKFTRILFLFVGPLPLQYCLKDSIPRPEQLYAYECMYICFLSFQLEKGFIIASASTVNSAGRRETSLAAERLLQNFISCRLLLPCCQPDVHIGPR